MTTRATTRSTRVSTRKPQAITSTMKATTKTKKAQAEPKRASRNGHKNGRVQPRKRLTLTSAATWEAMGIEISRVATELDSTEQETAISFLKGGRYAEITTADAQWQKQIESLGVRPRSITTFRNTKIEIRYYDRIPKSYVRMPSPNGES